MLSSFFQCHTPVSFEIRVHRFNSPVRRRRRQRRSAIFLLWNLKRRTFFKQNKKRKEPKKFNNGNHNLTINICASFYDFVRYLFGLAAAAAAAVQFSSNSFLFFFAVELQQHMNSFCLVWACIHHSIACLCSAQWKDMWMKARAHNTQTPYSCKIHKDDGGDSWIDRNSIFETCIVEWEICHMKM